MRSQLCLIGPLWKKMNTDLNRKSDKLGLVKRKGKGVSYSSFNSPQGQRTGQQGIKQLSVSASPGGEAWHYLSDFHQMSHISVTPTFILTTGRLQMRGHAVLSSWCLWKHSSEHLRALAPHITWEVGPHTTYFSCAGYSGESISAATHVATTESHAKGTNTNPW